MPKRPPRPTTSAEATGIYWFVDSDVARDLPGARLRMREYKHLGFTEVWIAARGLNEIGDASCSLTCDLYREFLRVAADEADHLGLGVVPFPMPCGLDQLSVAFYDLVACGTGRSAGSESLNIDLGVGLLGLREAFIPYRAYAYRTDPTLLGETIDADSVRSLDLEELSPALEQDGERLVTRIPAGVAQPGEEIMVAFITRPLDLPANERPYGRHWIDVTSPAFHARLEEVVQVHEEILKGRPCYIGQAFDEPNIGDPSCDPDRRRERVTRFYRSDSLAERLKDRRKLNFDKRLYAMVRPVSDIGYALRVAYYQEIQEALMEAMQDVMKHASVPMLGTHDWSGDRDRALYNTFDQMHFTRVRTYGATDISGFQGNFDYAVQEPLLAWQQKEAMGCERAMLMTDYFRENTDLHWLLYTCERHAAMGVDYMLLHAYGPITQDPPLWTRTESWRAYREPRALEIYTARMKQLGGLRDYRGRFNVLVVFPNPSRAIHSGDRFVAREWATMVENLQRVHHAPLTISQLDLDRVKFKGDEASYGGHTFRTICLPHFSAIGESQLKKLIGFHKAGGNLLITKPSPVLADGEGRPSKKVARMYRQIFREKAEPQPRKFAEGQTVSYGGRAYRVIPLPEGVSEYDDAYLDFGGGRNILEAESKGGGRAVLLGFELTALSYRLDMHTVEAMDGIELLSAIMERMSSRIMNCTDAEGREDFDTLGLLREREGELLLTAARKHDRLAILKAGRATVYLPGGLHPGDRAGANVFTHHVEEPVHVIHNPFGHVLEWADLGHEIAEAETYDRQWWYCHFSGSRMGLCLTPGRELRLGSISFGPRNPSLPADIIVEEGRVLEARTSKQEPGLTIVRVTGPEKLALSLTLDPALGERVEASCPTSGMETQTRVQQRDGRIHVRVEAQLLPTLENDIRIRQG